MMNFYLLSLFITSVIYSFLLYMQFDFIFTPVGWILSAVFYLLFPGLILIHLLNLDDWEIAKKCTFGFSLGIAHLLIFGYLYNSYAYWFNKDFSLTNSLFNIVYCLYFCITLGFILIIFRNKKTNIQFRFSKNYLYYLMLGILPVMSFFGAILLNNDGSNILTISLIIIIALILVFFGFVDSQLPNNIFPITIFMIAISLLWMYSLRSAYLVGWDIHQEFKVFQITKDIGLWDISHYRSAYNATLSITLLPTIIANITHIQDIYVYKLIFPLLFSFTPVLVYYIAKIHIKPYFAFLSAFFFMSQFQFMTQMPALNRQAIAFLFFGLLIYTFFSKSLSTSKKALFFVISTMMIVVSHYTTAYITAGLLISAYICSLIYNLLHSILKRVLSLKLILNLPKLTSSISLWMVLFFCVFTYIWYGFYTKVTNDLETLGQKLYTNINKIHEDEFKSEQARYAIWGNSNTSLLPTVHSYAEETRRVYENSRSWASPYMDPELEKYPINQKFSKVIPVSNDVIKDTSDIIIESDKKIIKTLMLIGAVYLLFTIIGPSHKEYSLDLIIFSLTGLILLTALSVIPFFSIYYNFERLYQQGLFVLGIALIIGTLFITTYKERIAKAILISLLLIYYLHFSGIITQHLGGTPSLALNNFGEEYDRFYTHQSELSSAKWLSIHAYPYSSISTDRYGWLRFQSYTPRNYGFLENVVSTAIPRYGYIYSSYANTTTGIARTNYKNYSIGYNFPKDFLNENKNLIYSSKQSIIYK